MFKSRPIGAHADSKSARQIGIKEAAEASD